MPRILALLTHVWSAAGFLLLNKSTQRQLNERKPGIRLATRPRSITEALMSKGASGTVSECVRRSSSSCVNASKASKVAGPSVVRATRSRGSALSGRAWNCVAKLPHSVAKCFAKLLTDSFGVDGVSLAQLNFGETQLHQPSSSQPSKQNLQSEQSEHTPSTDKAQPTPSSERPSSSEQGRV